MKFYAALILAFAITDAHALKLADNFDHSPDSVSTADNLEQSHAVK